MKKREAASKKAAMVRLSVATKDETRISATQIKTLAMRSHTSLNSKDALDVIIVVGAGHPAVKLPLAAASCRTLLLTLNLDKLLQSRVTQQWRSS